MPVLAAAEGRQQEAAIDVVADEQQYQHHLEMQPAGVAIGGPGVVHHQPQAEDHGEHRSWSHDAVVEFALHGLEARITRRILTQGVVDEQARQVEQARKPGDHEDDVEGFDPEHDIYL